jgi:hypothetical protein
MKEVEYNLITGHINEVIESLCRTVGQYKRNNTTVKIGITGRDPQIRFNEHLAEGRWQRMVVIYETNSENYANKIEEWLVDQHYEGLKNTRQGGGSSLSFKGKNYVYVLLR